MGPILIVLNTFDRFEILKDSIESLLKSDLSKSSKLIVFDDHSTDQRVISLLQDIPCELRISNKHKGRGFAVIESLKQISKEIDDPFFIHIESDVIYHPQWLNQLLDLKERSEKFKPGLLTIYRSEVHKVKTIEKDYDILGTTGGVCILVNVELINSLPIELGWDWNLSKICYEKGFSIIGSKESWVEHVGMNSPCWIGGKLFNTDHGLNSMLPGVFETYKRLWDNGNLRTN